MPTNQRSPETLLVNKKAYYHCSKGRSGGGGGNCTLQKNIGDSLKEKMDKAEWVAYYSIEACVRVFCFVFLGRFRKQGSVLN